MFLSKNLWRYPSRAADYHRLIKNRDITAVALGTSIHKANTVCCSCHCYTTYLSTGLSVGEWLWHSCTYIAECSGFIYLQICFNWPLYVCLYVGYNSLCRSMDQIPYRGRTISLVLARETLHLRIGTYDKTFREDQSTVVSPINSPQAGNSYCFAICRLWCIGEGGQNLFNSLLR